MKVRLSNTYIVLLILKFLEVTECFTTTEIRQWTSSSLGKVRSHRIDSTFLGERSISGETETVQCRPIDDISQEVQDRIPTKTSHLDRRNAIASLMFRSLAAMSATNVLLNGHSDANAATVESSLLSTTMAVADSTTDDFLRFRKIPTFCIVNTEGVPYMIFNKGNGSANGYFFMSFQVAAAVLEDAKSKPGSEQLWSDARIVTIPLDIALRLALSKVPRKALNNNNKITDTYSDIVPAEEGVEDAKFIDKKNGQNADRWLQKGRTPLFFATNKSQGKDAPIQYYFSRKDLVSAWTDESPPNIQVVELVDLFRKTGLDKMKNIELGPVTATQQIAQELIQKQKGTTTSFNFKDCILVSSPN